MTAKNKADRASRRIEKAEGSRERKNASRTGKQRVVGATPARTSGVPTGAPGPRPASADPVERHAR
jgi:hypothetical protein